jgi:histidinol dehydrogenase
MSLLRRLDARYSLADVASARFASALAVADFMKCTSIVGAGSAGLKALGPAAKILARAGGLQGRARSIASRLGVAKK